MHPENSLSQPPDAPRLRTGRLALVLGCLIALCYGAGLRDFFISDDFCTLATHTFVPGLAGLVGIGGGERVVFLRPLTELSWAFNLALGGLDPLGYHLLNCAFHLANAMLVAHLTLALGKNIVAAWVAGAVFACFPLHAEAVTWANGRVDVLCACGVLASLLCWVHYCASGGRLRHLLGSGLCFLLALGCKEMAVTLPVLAAVITLGCFPEAWARVWRGLLLLFALLFAYLAVRWICVGGIAGYPNAQGGSVLLQSSLANALAFLRFALEHVFVPSGWLLAGTPSHALALAAPFAWFAALIVCLMLRVPRRTALVALSCAALFLVSMAPVIGWVQFILGKNEPWRFLYLPSAFACAGLSLAFSFASGPRPRAVRIAACVLALLLLSSNVIGLRTLNARWHSAAQITQSMVEGIRQRYAGLQAIPPLVYGPVAQIEQGVSVFHNGFDLAIRLFVNRDIEVFPQGKWKLMLLRGDPLPSNPPLQLAWDHDARVWRDI